MITANQARALAGPTVDFYTNQLSDAIEIAAKAGQLSLTITVAPFNTWLAVPPNSISETERSAMQVLRKNGFKLTLSTKPTSGLTISWAQ